MKQLFFGIMLLLLMLTMQKGYAWTLPMDIGEFTQTTGVEPSSGKCNLYFKNDNKLYKYCNGVSELPVGSGAGGGLDSFLSEDYETTQSTDFGTGNNAAFLTAGTIDGAISNETSSPIAGTRSIKYTASTSSTNDWVSSPAISLDAKQRGQFIGISFYYKWSGSVDVPFVVKCTAGDTATFTDALDVVETASASTRFSTSIFISSACTEIKYGFHLTNAPTSGDILIWDDVELSTNPFVYKNLVELGSVSYTGYTGKDGSNYVQLSTIDSARSNLTANISVDNSTRTKYTMLKAGNVVVTAGINIGAYATRQAFIEHYNSSNTLIKSSYLTGQNDFSGFGVSLTTKASAGDYFVFNVSSSTPTNDTSTFFTITAISESEHIVTPAKSNMTDWATYSLTIGATTTAPTKGTIVRDNARWRRVGDTMEIAYEFEQSAAGSAGSGTYLFPVPSGYTIDTNKLSVTGAGNNEVIVGTAWGSNLANANGDATRVGVVVPNDTSNLKLILKGTTDAVSAVDESLFGGLGGTTIVYTFYARVPITGWTSDVSFLAATPVQKVAYLKDVKSSGTDGGTFTSGADQVRDLNTVEGDSEIVTLSSNQFTLGAGKYSIEWDAPAHAVSRNQSMLYDVTGAAILKRGTSCINTAASDGNRSSVGFATVEITSANTYEIRHRNDSTKATTGFGVATSFGDEVYTQVKITKLK